MLKVTLAVILLASPAWADDDHSWHLLAQSEGGTISLLKELTKHECEFALHRAKGEPATDQEAKAEKEREANVWAEAQDVCSHPEKYEHSAGHVNAMCSGGEAVGYGMGGHVMQPGDIRSAECFQ